MKKQLTTILFGLAVAMLTVAALTGSLEMGAAGLPLLLGTWNTTFGTRALKLLDDDIIIGTCMLGDDFGQILSADLERTADTREIKDCLDRLKALLMTNSGFKYTFTALFPASGTAEPEIGDLIELPYIETTGIVMPGTKIAWSAGGERAITIVAQSWDHLILTGGSKNADMHTYNVLTGAWTEVND